MDEALALPSEAAVTIALRTQQVLAHESGVAATADPLGGAYHVERLTTEIEAAAQAYLEKIEGLGGAVGAIPFMQQEIQEAAYRYQQEVETRARVVVGVNEFVTEEPPPAQRFQADPGVEARQVERLAGLRARRDQDRAARALDAVEQAATTGRENLVPRFLEAVRAEVTLGEISDRLREVFGTHRPSVGF
jgi:methylmalonyl-CoA mutase N-terminal domain/subunit